MAERPVLTARTSLFLDMTRRMEELASAGDDRCDDMAEQLLEHADLPYIIRARAHMILSTKIGSEFCVEHAEEAMRLMVEVRAQSKSRFAGPYFAEAERLLGAARRDKRKQLRERRKNGGEEEEGEEDVEIRNDQGAGSAGGSQGTGTLTSSTTTAQVVSDTMPEEPKGRGGLTSPKATTQVESDNMSGTPQGSGQPVSPASIVQVVSSDDLQSRGLIAFGQHPGHRSTSATVQLPIIAGPSTTSSRRTEMAFGQHPGHQDVPTSVQLPVVAGRKHFLTPPVSRETSNADALTVMTDVPMSEAPSESATASRRVRARRARNNGSNDNNN